MIEIVEATTAEQLARFQDLVDEFRAWDSAMSRDIGLDVDAVVDFLYKTPADPDAERASEQRIFLAVANGGIAGCGALKELSGDVAELTRVYVRPAFRGMGLGRAIVEAVLATARTQGYRKICLETAIFMKEAQALYRSVGFQVSPPFRQVPDNLKDAEVFMELTLGERKP